MKFIFFFFLKKRALPTLTSLSVENSISAIIHLYTKFETENDATAKIKLGNDFLEINLSHYKKTASLY